MMRRGVLALLVVLALVSGTWAQGQLINGNRVITGTFNAGTTTGSANAYILTLEPAITAYTSNQCFVFKANFTNAASATLNVNGAGAKTLQKFLAGGLANLTGGEIVSGQQVLTCYDGTVMQVIGGGSSGVLADAHYLTTQAEGSLSVESNLGALTTGILKHTVSGGVSTPATAVAGTDYQAPLGFTAQPALGYTAENAANKSTDPALGSSDTLYPSQKAVKDYVDGAVSGPGSGDASTDTATSVDGEAVLFSGTTGKLLKRSTLTGLLKSTAGVTSAATAGIDYQAALTGASTAPTTACFYDGNSHKTCFAPADLTADHNVSLPDADSTTVVPVVEAPPTATYVSYIDPDGVQHSADYEAAGLTDYADLVRVTAAQKVTNKVLPPSPALLSASSGTVTAPNVDLYEVVYRHDVAGALTIPNPVAPVTSIFDPFQALWVCLKSAVPQTITLGVAYTAEFGYALPTTTTGTGTRFDCWKFVYNPTSTNWGLIATTTTTTILAATDGGTGFGSYTVGDILYANTTTTLAKLAAGTNGHVLKSNGAGVAPSYAAVAAGTGTIPLNVGSAYYPTTNPGQPRVDEKRPSIRFDGTTAQSIFWVSVVPADYAGSPVFYYTYSLVSATSGTHIFNVTVMVLSDSTGDWLATDSFDTLVACTDAAVPGTAGQSHTISCALTTNDSMVAGKLFAVNLARDVADTNNGTSELLGAWIQYAK